MKHAVFTMTAAIIVAGLLGGLGCDEPELSEERRFQSEKAPAERNMGQVHILQPAHQGKLLTTVQQPNGQAITVECSACHTLHQSPPYAKTAADLKDFHADMAFGHGNLQCLSCHAKDDRSKLHLATQEHLAFEQTMELCAQCHGPQYRDYQNGSHGGMTGHWDLESGDRYRNSCTYCHNPHTPAYPKVLPVFAPKDRFLTHTSDHGENP